MRETHNNGDRYHTHHSHGDGYRPLVQEPGSYLLFIGSYSCTRHKGTERMELQQEGKLSFLCLQEIDWITGGYDAQICQAARQLVRLFDIRKLILFGGCQLELLNVDMAGICERLTSELNIQVKFHRGCHLVGYGQELVKQ